MGHCLADKIEVYSTGDSAQFLPVVDESARFKFRSVRKHWVLTSLKGLKKPESQGPDLIPTKILTDAAELIYVPLAIIFSESFWNGVFPELWNLARVIPIVKSGQQSDMNNYRPISVLSGVSRLFERLIHDLILI